MVRRGVSHRSQQPALDESDRGAYRAQLAARHRPHSRRGRSWTESRRGDRDADRGTSRRAFARNRAVRRDANARTSRDERRGGAAPEGPFVWTFDGPFGVCLNDIEDTFRRAIVQIGDVARIAVMIDVSLPALRSRVQAGDAIQPAWSDFLD